MSFQLLEKFEDTTIVCVELDEKLIEKAQAQTPDHLKSRFTIHHGSIEAIQVIPLTLTQRRGDCLVDLRLG